LSAGVRGWVRETTPLRLFAKVARLPGSATPPDRVRWGARRAGDASGLAPVLGGVDRVECSWWIRFPQ